MSAKDAELLTTMAVERNNECRAAVESMDATSALAQGMASISSGVLALLMLEHEREADRLAFNVKREALIVKLEQLAFRALEPAPTPPPTYATETDGRVVQLLEAIAAAYPALAGISSIPQVQAVIDAFNRCNQPIIESV